MAIGEDESMLSEGEWMVAGNAELIRMDTRSKLASGSLW